MTLGPCVQIFLQSLIVLMFFPKKNELFTLCGPAGLLLATYILVFLRQYFWFSDSIFVSWCIPLVLSVCLSVLIRRRFSYELPRSVSFDHYATTFVLLFFKSGVSRFLWDIVNYHFINSSEL